MRHLHRWTQRTLERGREDTLWRLLVVPRSGEPFENFCRAEPWSFEAIMGIRGRGTGNIKCQSPLRSINAMLISVAASADPDSGLPPHFARPISPHISLRIGAARCIQIGMETYVATSTSEAVRRAKHKM
jgi:hypothetical protein